MPLFLSEVFLVFQITRSMDGTTNRLYVSARDRRSVRCFENRSLAFSSPHASAVLATAFVFKSPDFVRRATPTPPPPSLPPCPLPPSFLSTVPPSIVPPVSCPSRPSPFSLSRYQAFHCGKTPKVFRDAPPLRNGEGHFHSSGSSYRNILLASIVWLVDICWRLTSRSAFRRML